MDEPVISFPWPPSSLEKKPAECLYDELSNALLRDDKDEFLRLIKDPEFEPMRQYHRDEDLFLREINMSMILRSGALQIAIAVLNGEARGIIDDVQLVFKDGWTPLHLGCATPCPKLIKYLIERGDPLDVRCDYAFLNLKQATPLDLALENIDYGYENGFKTSKRPWTPRCSIFELLEYLCEWQRSCLEVIRLLVQNTQNKENVRKAFFDYADKGKLVKIAALFLAAPELFLSPSQGGGSMSSIDTLYLNLNSLDKRTDIEDGLLLLLDVFKLVGHMLIAYLRVSDPKVWNLRSWFGPYPIGFFLREAAHKKLGISSPDDYLLSFFKPVSHVYRSPSSKPSTVDTRVNHSWYILLFKMKRKNIDIDYVNRMIPSLKRHDAAVLRKAIENKLSTMPNICTLFEGSARIPNKGGKQSSSFPRARSIELMRTRSFCTEAANAKHKLDFKLYPGDGWESRVMNPTKLESFFSARRLSHFRMIAKRLIK